MHFPAPPAPIIVQMGDAAIDALSRPSCAHYRTDGGRIVVQMGDAATDAPLRSSRMCLENVVHLPLKVEKKHTDNIRPPRECASGSERTPVPS